MYAKHQVWPVLDYNEITNASGHRSQLEERDLQWHERGDLAEVRRCDGQAGVEATF